MEKDVIGPTGALKEGCGLLRRYPIVVLGFAVFVSLAAICIRLSSPSFDTTFEQFGYVHVANWVLLPTVLILLLGGLHRLVVNAARDANPRLTDLFSGFRHLSKWLGAGLTAVGVYGAFLLACFGIMLTSPLLLDCYGVLNTEAVRTHMLALAAILAPPLAFALFLQYAFALFAASDAEGACQSIDRSKELVKGRHLRLVPPLLTGFLLPVGLLGIGCLVHFTNANAFGWPGWVAYWLGVGFAAVVALCVLAATYVRLDRLTPSRTATPA